MSISDVVRKSLEQRNARKTEQPNNYFTKSSLDQLSADINGLSSWKSQEELAELRKKFSTIERNLMQSGDYSESTIKLYSSVKSAREYLDSITPVYSRYNSAEEYNKYSSSGWLSEDAETNDTTSTLRKEWYQRNEDRIADIDEDLPWYANTWLPNWAEDIFLSDDKEILRDEAERLKAENNQYMNYQGKLDAHYMPITDEVTQTASNRAYSNASMEDLWVHDASFRELYSKLQDGHHYLDENGNLVNSTTGKVERASDAYSMAVLNEDSEGFYNSVIQDKLGFFLSASEDDLAEAYNRLSAGSGNVTDTWANTLRDGDVNGWKYLTEDEITIYYYKYNTEGQESAYKFLEDMTNVLTRRETEKREEEINGASALEQIAMNIASIPMNTVGGAIAFGEDAIKTIRGEEINPYSRGHAWINDASAIRNKTAMDINEATGNASLPWVGTTFGDVYQALMSGADSVMASYIPGGHYLLGLNAASSTMKDVYDRGGSTEQMLASGILAGAAEAFFEKYSIGELNKLKHMDSKTVKNFSEGFVRAMVMGGVEASEEMATEIANTITDALVMGSQSNWEDFDTFVRNVVNAGIGGLVSGGAMGGVASAVNNANYKKQAKQYGQSIMEESGQGGVDALKKLALEMYSDKSGLDATRGTRLASRVADKASAKNVGMLADHVQNSITSQNESVYAKAFVEKGLSKKVAGKVAKYLVGSNELSKEDVATIEKSKRIQTIIDEVLTDPNFEMGDASIKLMRAMASSKPSAQQASNPVGEKKSSVTETSTAKEIVSEGKFKASTDGKAKIGDMEVSIKEIASVKDGEVILRLEDGSTVNARDVDLASADEVLIYENVAHMNLNAATANAFVNGYDPSMNVQEYILGFREAYRYGEYGYPVQEMSAKGFSARLSESQKTLAYNLGKTDAKYKVEKKQSENAKIASTDAIKAGKDSQKTTKKGKLHNTLKPTNETQRASLKALGVLAEALNIDIYTFESPTDANGKRLGENGRYETATRTLYIDLFAGADGKGTMLFTAAHELTHHIRETLPAKFKAFADFLFEQYGEKGVSVSKLVAQKIADLKANNRTEGMTDAEIYDRAYEEVVADACESFLADGEAVAKIAELKAKDKTLWETIKDFITKLVARIKAAYEGLNPDSEEGNLVAKMLDSAEQLKAMWTEMLVESSEIESAVAEVIEADAKPISTDEIITDGAVVTDGKGKKYSIRSMKHDISDGQMFRDLMNHCGFTKAQVGELRRQLEDLVDYMNPYRDIVDLNETYDMEGRRYAPYKPNSDPLYTISLDFSTQCSKRLLTQYVIEQLQLRENRPMSPEEQMAIRDMLKEYGKVEKGLQVACVMCYVEAARLKAPKQIQKWLDDPATAMRNFFADKNPEFSAYIKEKQADFKESKGYDRNATKKDMSAKDRTALNKIRPKLRAEYKPSAEEMAIIETASNLPNSTYLTAGNLADLSETNPEIYKAYTAFIRTATRSKALETDEPYYYGDSTRDNGNGIIVSDSFIEAVNRENGMRFSSWSDWRVQHLLDWITAVIDNSVRGAAMHGYTKYGEEVRVLGKTGMMFNMSGVAGTQTGLNEDGSLNFSETESMDYDEAIALREEFPETAGLQCIGVGIDHIYALLRSDVIDYVIPYHTSGLNATLRRMGDIYGWKDFTQTQHATEDKSIKKEDAVDPDHWHQEPVYSEFFVGYDTGLGGVEAMRESAENYKRMCRERGLIPKFNEFAKEPNYWKLLIDRKMVNQKTNTLIKQKAVTPTFDFGVIKGIVDKYVANYDSGLEQRAFNHIVENWDNIPKRIRDLKKQGSTKAKSTKKAIDMLSNETVAVQPKRVKNSDRVSNKEAKYSDRVLMGSLFSGGGTLEAGLAYQMLDKEFGVEYDGKIASVYADNHGDHIQVGRVEDFDISKYDDIFYLHASPVCHNFSKAKHGAKELQMDIDSAKATAKHLETAMPQVFTVENAPGYRKSQSLKIITDKLTELGYKWDVDVYNSADYGSATSRNRVILRAVKDGELPAKPSKQERTNSWDKATRDLWDTLPKSYLRPSFISAIENTPKLPILDANGKVNVNKPLLILTTTSGHMVTYCWEGEICPTLTTKCGEAKLVMPDGNIYAVTPEFMGRIQGLPDDYKYPEAKTRAFTIIGNGIPTHLTKAVVGGVLDSAYEQSHDGQVLYSDRNFGSQVDAVLNGADTNSTHLKLMDTPSLLQEAGLPNLPILMTAKHLKKITATTGHGLDVEMVKKLPEYISSPVMIADSFTRDDSVVIITEAIDSENRPVVAAIMLNGTGQLDNKYVNANIMTSAYGRNNFQSFLNRIADSNSVIYWDKEKSQDLSLNLGVQFPNVITSLDSGIIIHQAKAFVNTQIKEKNSDRSTDSFSNRSLLANALESVAQNDIERNKLKEYKSKIALIESEQAKLAEVRAKIKELSFAKGQRDVDAIKNLQFEANQAANRINTYDKQLLNLESTKALKGVLEREKQMAYKRAEKKGKEALEAYRERATKTQRELLTRYQESRKKNIEGRKQTAMRHKIKDVVNELNQYLLKGTKDKHVPIELQKAVAEALDAVNMDTVGAEERIAKKREEMMRAKTPEAVERLAKEIENIQEMGGNMAKKISHLKTSYDSIINSDDPIIANSHDEVIANTIDKVMEVVGDTPLRDMSLYQLEAVYDMYRMILHSIRTANKAFKAEKGEEISVLANTVISDLASKKRNPLNLADTTFAWNNLKPVYAFERIGSNTMTKLFNAVREGEDVWARDMSEAQAFREEQAKKHKFGSWDFKKKYTFTTHRGTPFELDLGEMMSIYAFAKDEHSKGHLIGEGFVFDPKKEVVENVKGKIKVKVNLEDATAYNLSEEIVEDIKKTLYSIPGAKEFVDEMQDYLSTTMGEKGNEVSLELYQIKLFKNKNYFPLKVAPQYMAVAKEKAQGDAKIKNKGFTKDRKDGASNPIVLSSFMDVWASHVNEMSMYHAFTLPLEDFYRVFNYKTPRMEGYAPMSVNASLENAYGKGATQYIDQLLKDLNGGARVDPTAGIINKMTGLFKKSAVFGSLSVVIQQPSAIARATALVDTKYFVGKRVTKAKHKETWAEVKKYAPVAIIKEMGYFDTGMGQSSVEWLKGEKTWKDRLDDIASKAPALADELAWSAIWNAVKRETLYTHKDLKPNSDEFLKAVGERFTEVITKTQVYDSVLARSAYMRSKDTGMKMATAFMGEPTTSINMIQDALTQWKRGNKRYARKAIGGVVASMILNSILVSFVYAGRDDDEDKTYAEKYVNTLTEELLDSINPLTLIPFVKDIVSIAQGYDVERSDMAVITDLINAWNNLDSDNRSVYRKVEDFAGAIASIFGLPVKNIMRDARGMYNTVNSFINGEQTTGAGIRDAFIEGVTGEEKSNGQKLYEAMLSGDTTQIERVKGRFKDQSAINSAIRELYNDGDISNYYAQKMLVQYGGKTEDEAESKVQYWDFKKRYPDYDLSEEAVAKYYEYAEPSGISIDLYYNYYEEKSKCEGIDSNGDGKADTGTKKEQILEVIDSLPLTSAQKDVLYYLNGWSASTIWEAPWH